jgi:hypothetical protein
VQLALEVIGEHVEQAIFVTGPGDQVLSECDNMRKDKAQYVLDVAAPQLLVMTMRNTQRRRNIGESKLKKNP